MSPPVPAHAGGSTPRGGNPRCLGGGALAAADAAFTPAQRGVVAHEAGPLLVQAGPGSGKTAVLVARAARLAATVPPGGLWYVTFTVAARREAAARLAALSGPECARRVRCGTFHAYAFGVVRAAARGAAPELLLEGDRLRVLRQLLFARGAGRRRGDAVEEGAVEALAAAISLAINTGATRSGDAADLRAVAARAGLAAFGVDPEDFPQLCALYAEAKAEAGRLDLDDLLWEALGCLRADPARLAAERARIQHIQVDEFQDVNRPQWELLRLLAAPADNVLAVGDADQAVYGFRGASPRWMRAFTAAWPQAPVLALRENFRSRPLIVAAANRLIAHNRGRIAFAGRSVAVEPGTVVAVGYSDARAEAQAICAKVRRALDEGFTPPLAVLCRTRTEAATIAHALAEAGLAVAVRDDTGGPFRHWVAQDLLAYLRLALDPADAAALRRVANHPRRYISADMLARAGGRLDGLAGLPDLPRWRQAYVRGLCDGIAALRPLAPAGALAAVRGQLGYDAFLEARGSDVDAREWAAVADALAALAVEARDYHHLVERVRAADRRLAAGAAAPQVVVSTCHAAKGLEFDAVFVAGCVPGRMPHRSAADAPAVEEERRLCYVAFTRARRLLCVSWSAEPSPFLSEAGLVARPVPLPAPERRSRRSGAPA